MRDDAPFPPPPGPPSHHAYLTCSLSSKDAGKVDFRHLRAWKSTDLLFAIDSCIDVHVL